MNLRSFFFILLTTLWLTACGTEAEIAVQPPTSTSAVVATTTDEPLLETSVPMVTAVATKPAIEPSVTAANTPTSQPISEADPPLPLPQLVPAVSLSGDFPQGISWSLATELPQAATAVAVLSQPTNQEPLTAEQATLVGQQYGFDQPLYLEYRTGFTMDELMDLGMFVIFDGWRKLSLSGSLYFYNDASHQPAAFDLPFTEAAPIAEQFLKDNGWLTFPYEMAESDQGEGVLFLPILNGVLLSSPAYGVRVAGDGGISTVFIYPQDNLDEVGHYPILTADSAWQQVLANPNQPGIFYQIDAPPSVTTITYPSTYNRMPAPSEAGTVYNNIWVYRPVSGDAPPIIVSSNFSRINGDPTMLEELAAETDYLVQLTGTVREPSPGVRTLDLSSWQLMTDMGGLPRAFGQIMREDGQTFLVDAANNATYLLPDAPADLQLGVETAVSGIPDTIDGVQTLNWQEIEAYPPQAETIMPTPTGPMHSVTIDSAKLVYLRMPAHVSGLADTLSFPVWQFKGVADNGERVTVWVTAVLPDYISPSNP